MASGAVATTVTCPVAEIFWNCRSTLIVLAAKMAVSWVID
jgi:hypothetical protein